MNVLSIIFSYVVFPGFLFAAVIIASAFKAFKSRPKRFSGLIAAVPLFLLLQNFPLLNHREEFIFYDYAKNMLRTLPRNALLFSDRADEMEFAVAYLHMAEGRRADAEVVNFSCRIKCKS